MVGEDVVEGDMRFRPGWGNVFGCTIYPHDEEYRTALANLITDVYLARLAIEDPARFKEQTHLDAVDVQAFQRFLEIKPEVNHLFHPEFQRHAEMPINELGQLVEAVKGHTLIQARLFTDNVCEANCKECYTKKQLCPGEEDASALTLEESVQYLEQAKKLGARVLYTAGRGEPLQDKKFLPLLGKAHEMGYDVLFFTNGILLSNQGLAEQYFGRSNEDVVDFLVSIGANVYHKLWSMDDEKFDALMGLSGKSYQEMRYCEDNFHGQKIHIPAGLALHLEKGNLAHIGVECRVGTDTYDEVKELIIPWIESVGIRSYVEPHITSGRGFNTQVFQCAPEQLAFPLVARYLTRRDCRLPSYIASVLEEGTMAFCLSLESERIRKLFDPQGALNIRGLGGVRDIYTIMHTHPFITGNKYSWQGCRCQRLNEEIRGLGR